MANGPIIYGGDYEGPTYTITQSVWNLRRLPRFGYNDDITSLVSSDEDAQASYATGLVALFLFILIFFIFWTVLIMVFKCMGPGNAGFLSGHHFVIPDPCEDEKKIYKRPFRVRLVFLIAAGFLMLFSLLFVTMGLTNVDNTVTTLSESLQQLGDIVKSAELIASKLEQVGNNSIEIRDAAVAELDNFCPANPNLNDAAGVDVMGIADQAKADLTMLADFIRDGLETLHTNLGRVRSFADNMNDGMNEVEFWGWQFKLLSAGLFIIPSFLVVGVGLVMLDLNVRPYQKALTYFFMPLFSLIIVASYVVCAAVLPISATNADTCIGGGEYFGGPDDTVLTVYRNLRGDDPSILFQLVAYYTQRCDTHYYPYAELSKYLDDLDGAVDSTNTVVQTVQDNLDLLLEQCGRSFDSVVRIVKDMNINLRVLREQADQSLELVQCKNINSLYVNTIHEATCKYSVDALAWIFAASLIISICGLIMIMLRSAYYPAQYLELSDHWIKSSASTTSETKASPTKSNNSIGSRSSGGNVKEVHEAAPLAPIKMTVLEAHGDGEFEVCDVLQEF